MGRTQALRSVAHNVAASYLSTYNYFAPGYAIDWLFNLGQTYNENTITIEVLSEDFQPLWAKVAPLTNYLPTLRSILDRNLASPGLSDISVSELTLTFKLEIDRDRNRFVSCVSRIVIHDNRAFEGKPVREKVLEPPFDPRAILARVGRKPVVQRIWDSLRIWHGYGA